MVTVDVVSSSFTGGLTAQVCCFGLGSHGHPVLLSLHSSDELGELMQWLCDDDSTKNTVILALLLQNVI